MGEVVTAARYRVCFLVFVVAVQLMIYGHVGAEEIHPDEASEHEVIGELEQHEMSLVSLDPWVVEGEVLGIVRSYVYSDVITGRCADYWEFYDREGDLLAVSWFDKFGIQRAAIDEGIAQQRDELQGVFVMVLDGQFI